MPKRDPSTSPSESEDVMSTSAPPPAKKSRLSTESKTPIAEILAFSKTTVDGLPKETLANHLIQLQAAYIKLQASASDGPSQSKPLPIVEDPAKVKEKAAKLANMMGSGIRKQMKWQPSCKTSGKRWAYTSMVPSTAVFYALFGLKEEKKAWKQKKIPLEAFEDITGGLGVSIRYGYLRVTSKETNLKWDREENSFTVSGLYGL